MRPGMDVIPKLDSQGPLNHLSTTQNSFSVMTTFESPEISGYFTFLSSLQLGSLLIQSPGIQHSLNQWLYTLELVNGTDETNHCEC